MVEEAALRGLTSSRKLQNTVREPKRGRFRPENRNTCAKSKTKKQAEQNLYDAAWTERIRLLTPVDFTYTVFGLTLRSNLPIPGLARFENSLDSAVVDIHWGQTPSAGSIVSADSEELVYTSSYNDESGNPGLRIWKSTDDVFLHLFYYDRIEFWLERKGRAVWAVWPETSTLEDASSYLLGPVLGLLLRLRGVTCLHASAVALENRSIALVGAEGTGKSTTAAAFAREGHGVIADDVAALEECSVGFRVIPAYPHVSLWPDSVEMLYGSSEALPRFSAGWEKRRLSLGENGARFEKNALPLGAVYLLGERRPDPAPYVEVMRSQAALLSLVADSYANKILDREMRSKEFEVLGRLASTVPVRRVFPHSDAARLRDLCRVIENDFAALTDSTRAHS
jgi:hypothetical protein